MNFNWKAIGVLVTVVFLWSCKKEQQLSDSNLFINEIPKGFSQFEEPADNTYSYSRWLLGKKLFYDKALSADSSTSCSSCHQQQFGFSDQFPVSVGFNALMGRSNAPPLVNLAWQPYFTRAGGTPTLEKQILIPIQEHDELNLNMLELIDRLQQNSEYENLSYQAYNKPLSAYTLVRALACFERSLISGNSPFDQYAYHKKANALSTSAQNGMKLFFSNRTKCSFCHSGFNFTNYSFQNNGLYEEYADTGRMKLTLMEADRALFKVPTLRNLIYSAPYMHDGSIDKLEDVIEHYNSGGSSFKNKSNWIAPLHLSEEEKTDLLHFLESLSDPSFIQNINFKP